MDRTAEIMNGFRLMLIKGEESMLSYVSLNKQKSRELELSKNFHCRMNAVIDRCIVIIYEQLVRIT